MESDVRVCPFCGNPPGAGMFCEACGRNLAAVERLPSRAEWETARPAGEAADRDRDSVPLADRCAAATAAFLAAMHSADDPGAVAMPTSGGSGWRRARKLDAWLLRAVHRASDDEPTRYVPGLVITVEGRFHRLVSEVRGWGQRDFPRFYDTIDAEPIDMPVEERLPDELAAVLRANAIVGEPPATGS